MMSRLPENAPKAPARPKPTILNLMIFVVFGAILLSTMADRGNTPWHLLIAFALPLLYLWTVGPITIHRTQFSPLHPEFRRFELSDPIVPPPLAEAIARIGPELRGLGFEPVGHFRMEKSQATAVAYSSLYADPRGLDVAQIISVATVKGVTMLVAYRTRFADGIEVVTSNNKTPAVWPPSPMVLGLPLPDVDDVAALYRYHRVRVDRHGGFVAPQLRPGGDGMAYLVETNLRELERVRALGYYWVDEARGVQRPTWKGAILMACRLLWPVAPIRRALRRAKANRFIREVERERF